MRSGQFRPERVAGLAGAKSLADAWTAVIKGDKNAGKLLDAVPAAQRSAGYLFAKARYLRRSKKFSEAAAVMLKAPTGQSRAGRPRCMVDRAPGAVARTGRCGRHQDRLSDRGRTCGGKLANAVDAEFHAGWYALRGLDDAERGGETFRAHRRDRRRPDFAFARLLLARPHGRSRRPGRRQRPTIDAPPATAPRSTANSPPPKIATRRHQRGLSGAVRRRPAEFCAAARPSRRSAGWRTPGTAWRADILYRDLAEQLTSPGELALLAAMAEKRGNHFLALRVGKIAAGARHRHRCVVASDRRHPGFGEDFGGAGKALAYAIARQESEFNVGAVSGAGATRAAATAAGTAKEVAKKSGLPYSKIAADIGCRLQCHARRCVSRRAARPVRRLLCADLRRLQCRARAAPGTGSSATATRAARTSTRWSTGSSASRSRRPAAMCSG